jgi:hypothetical protein
VVAVTRRFEWERVAIIAPASVAADAHQVASHLEVRRLRASAAFDASV